MTDERWKQDENLKLVLSKIGDNYVLERKLGGGGYSTVYLIRHIILGKKSALKILDTEYIKKTLQKGNDTKGIEKELSNIKERFLNEGKLCTNIKHQNIVSIEDAGIASNEETNHEVPYLILEYIEGETLSQKLRHKIPVDIEKILTISKDILLGIGKIHENNIIHRDIKTSNVMIRKSNGKAVLIDFGIAKELENKMKLTKDNVSLGTSQYMPPEQFDNFKKVNKRGDIYSFGVVLYEMLTGETPFTGTQMEIMYSHANNKVPDIIDKNPNAPLWFQTIIEKAMAKNQDERYQSAEEFLTDITNYRQNSDPEIDNCRIKKHPELNEVIKEIGNEYKVLKCLDKGGFSNIYLVRHKKKETLCIIKVMKHTQLIGKDKEKINDYIKSFLKIYKWLKKKGYGNFIKIYNVAETKKSNIPYVLMDYIDGYHLSEFSKEKSYKNDKDIIKIISSILSDLKILHQDNAPTMPLHLNSSSVIIEKESGRTILIDFGLNQFIKKSSRLSGKNIKYEYPYMSPEQLKGLKTIKGTSAIYSLGVIFFELVVGNIPFNEIEKQIKERHFEKGFPNLIEKNSEVLKEYKKIIVKATAKNPKERYHSSEDFLAELKKLEDKYDRQEASIKKLREKSGTHPDLEKVILKIWDTYEFIECIDKGNVIDRYLVRHRKNNAQCVLKVMNENHALLKSGKNIENAKERFSNEGELLAKINHKNIVDLYDFGFAGEKGIPYLVVEYVEGKSLRKCLDNNTPLDFKRCIKIAGDILSAFIEMHQTSPPVTHKDIKPSNIMIEEKSGRALLTNFVLSNSIAPLQDSSKEIEISESSYYISAEHWIGISNLSPASDIYSLGIVLFEMSTGKRPFNGMNNEELEQQHLNDPVPDPRKIKSKLPKGIHKLLRKAMAKKPKDRYKSAREFLADLKGIENKYKEQLETIEEIEKRIGTHPDLNEVIIETDNAYEILECLNKEGFSRIYLVRHKESGTEHILKVMSYTQISEKSKNALDHCIERFSHEEELLEKITHKNITKLYDSGLACNEKIPYLVLEYIEGKNLDESLKQNVPISFEKSLKIITDILFALREMHNNSIVHRDIKPLNIMIENKDDRAILIDFGLAENIDHIQDSSKEIEIIEYSYYMSPEQWKGIRKLGPESDIYSIGIVLYEMLTGEQSFKGENDNKLKSQILNDAVPDPRKINANLPKGIHNIILKATAKRPEKRYRSVDEFLADLKKIEDKYKKESKKIQKQTEKRAKKAKKEIEKKLRRLKQAEGNFEQKLKKEDDKIVNTKSALGNAEKQLQHLKESEKKAMERAGEEAKKINDTLKSKDVIEKEAQKLRNELKEAKKKAKEKFHNLKDLEAAFNSAKKAIENIKNREVETITKISQESQNLQNSKNAKGKIEAEAQELRNKIIELEEKIKEKSPELQNTEEAKEVIEEGEAKKINDVDNKEIITEDDIDTEKIDRDNTGSEEEKPKSNFFKYFLGIIVISALAAFIIINLLNIGNGKSNLDEQYRSHISDVKEYIKIRRFDKAITSLDEAKKIKDTPEIKTLADQISEADKNLPPQNNWTNISQNSEGYYQKTFTEFNNHIMIYIPEKKFWIDKYEVSIKQFRNYDSSITGNDDCPVTVKYRKAIEYCENYKLVIPTEDEWEYAAGRDIRTGKGEKRIYPWGNQAPDEGGTYRANFSSFDDGYPEKAPFESFEQFSSPFGVVNMAGNVWEWVQEKELKGGDFLSFENDLRIKNSGDPNAYKEAGFRCIRKEK